jgi:hypothetical protein
VARFEWKEFDSKKLGESLRDRKLGLKDGEKVGMKGNLEVSEKG